MPTSLKEKDLFDVIITPLEQISVLGYSLVFDAVTVFNFSYFIFISEHSKYLIMSTYEDLYKNIEKIGITCLGTEFKIKIITYDKAGEVEIDKQELEGILISSMKPVVTGNKTVINYVFKLKNQ